MAATKVTMAAKEAVAAKEAKVEGVFSGAELAAKAAAEEARAKRRADVSAYGRKRGGGETARRRKDEERKRLKAFDRKLARDLETPHSPWYFAKKYGYTMPPGSFTPDGSLHDDVFEFADPRPRLPGCQVLGGLLDIAAIVFLAALRLAANDAFARARRDSLRDRENARRRELRAARRKIRPRATTNPCPTREQFLDAWARRKESREAIVRLGGLLEDLECYVDNSLVWDAARQNIRGRRGGVKAWLFENVPEIDCTYANVMRYKALAKKIKQAAEIADPEPLAAAHPAVGKLLAEADGDGFAELSRAVERALERRAKDEARAEAREARERARVARERARCGPGARMRRSG